MTECDLFDGGGGGSTDMIISRLRGSLSLNSSGREKICLNWIILQVEFKVDCGSVRR